MPRFLIPVFALTFAFTACTEAPKVHVAPKPPPPATDLVEPREIVLVVEGMTCDGCRDTITTELRKTGAVGACDVQLASKEARFTYDASRLKPDDLVIAVRRAGYTATVKP